MALMTARARRYVVLLIAMVSAFVYSRVTRDWSAFGFYAGGAGLIALLVVFGNLWIDFAPDGRQPRPGDRPAAD
jgi:uncharacterized membrane protein YedE/YeeE